MVKYATEVWMNKNIKRDGVNNEKFKVTMANYTVIFIVKIKLFQ